MLTKILSAPEDELLREERAVLGRLRVALARFDAAREHQQALEQSIAQLDELFLLVIVGEFNAGKSAFINALVGSKVAEEGVTPTTAQINVLQYGETLERKIRESSLHVITAPAEILREIHIVDTPGTNAIIREHEAITSEFVPRSDLVLFVTSADRPFTETERVFLEQVRGWGKKVVIVINKIDILEGEPQVEEVRAFVADNARALLGFSPEIFPVSARLALRAKQGDPSAWAASRFEALERYIRETLDSPGRVHLKLLNPLGVGAALTERHAAVVRDRAALLKDDFATLDEVERQLAVFQAGPDARLRLPHRRHRQHPARDGEARAGVLRRDDAHRPGHGSAQPQPHAAGVRAAGRRRRAAADRAEGGGAGGLARRRRPAAVAGRHQAPRAAPPAVPGSDRRRRGRGPLPLRSHAPHRLGRPRIAARRRLLRSPQGSARAGRRRAQCRRRGGGGQRRGGRAGHDRHDGGDDRGGRRDRAS